MLITQCLSHVRYLVHPPLFSSLNEMKVIDGKHGPVSGRRTVFILTANSKEKNRAEVESNKPYSS
jgi:hypothetical protein